MDSRQNALHQSSAQLFFVQGKGGTGKTSFSKALARHFAKKHRTAWIEMDGPRMDEVESVSHLTSMNLEPHAAFEEYVGLKLKIPRLASMFLHNSLIRSLVRAAPGVHELVLLGKIWHERQNFQKIVVDMPSTGFGLTMFQATKNFSQMLHGSLVEKDAVGMLETFGDPHATAHVIVSLPEEMPLTEAMELERFLQIAFPKITPYHVVNKIFPVAGAGVTASEALDFIRRRNILEKENLEILKNRPYQAIPFLKDPQSIETFLK